LLASYLRVSHRTNHIELNLLNTSALDNGRSIIQAKIYASAAAAPLAGGRIENGTDELAVRVIINRRNRKKI
jgi:predicted oxidoreductase